ncbi:MAG: hypothetical protein ACKVT2_22375 [Saprospiraceae bacterium]
MENTDRPIQRAHLIRQVEYAFLVVNNLQHGKDPEGNLVNRKDNRLSELVQIAEETRQYVLQFAKQEGNQYLLDQAKTIPSISPEQFRVSTNRNVLEHFAQSMLLLQLLFFPAQMKNHKLLKTFIEAAHPAFNRILSVLKQPGMEAFFQQAS